MTTTTTNKDPNRDELIRLRKELAKAGGMKGWKTIDSAPMGEHFQVMTVGVSGVGLAVGVQWGDGFIEWIEPSGRTTVTHNSMPKPTHWQRLAALPSPEALSIQSQIDALKGEKGGE